MTHAELEAIYESLAQAIDEAGDCKEVFLAKLVLLLANKNGNAKEIQQLIDNAATSLK